MYMCDRRLMEVWRLRVLVVKKVFADRWQRHDGGEMNYSTGRKSPEMWRREDAFHPYDQSNSTLCSSSPLVYGMYASL